MKIENVVAKLTAKGVAPSPDRIAGGKGSTLDQATVAGMLAGLPDAAYWLARAKYLGDELHMAWLLDHTTALVARTAAARDWGDLGGERARAIAALLLTPAVQGVKCRSCTGRGTHNKRRGVVVPCPSCLGTGRGEISERRQAEACGVPPTTWRRVWRQRVADLARHVHEWEVIADDHLARQLRLARYK